MGHRVVVANGMEGFRLSKAACERLLELGLSEREIGYRNQDRWLDHRHDPRLIQVVEEMGDLACQEQQAYPDVDELSIVDLDGDQYWIFDSYQGMEHIWEPNDINWTTIAPTTNLN